MSPSQSVATIEAAGYTTIDEEYGMMLVESPVDANIDVCFLHGLTGNRKTTWTQKVKVSGKEIVTFWPKDLLPTDLPKARILSWGYNASVTGVLEAPNTVDKHSRDLLDFLSNMRERDGTNTRPIIFVVHSLGGLVLEAMLMLCDGTSAKDEPKYGRLLESTCAIMYFGTPHGGSNKEKMAQVLRRFAEAAGCSTNKKILDVLDPHSEVLAMIEHKWQSYLRNRPLHSSTLLPIKIHNYFEKKSVILDVLGFKILDVGVIVPDTSAIMDAYGHTGIDADHIKMCKFGSRNNDYTSVSNSLWVWARDCLDERQEQRPETREEVNAEVRERRQQYQARSNVHTLNNSGPSVNVAPVYARGNVTQSAQAAGRDINN